MPVSSPTSEAIAGAVEVWNLRLTVLRLRAAVDQVLSARSKLQAPRAGSSHEALQEEDLASRLQQLSLSGSVPQLPAVGFLSLSRLYSTPATLAHQNCTLQNCQRNRQSHTNALQMRLQPMFIR